MQKMRQVIPFVLLTFILTWMMWWMSWFLVERLLIPTGRLWIHVSMWVPAFSYWMLKCRYPEDIHLGAGFFLNFKKKWHYYLLALWVPFMVTVLGCGLYFLLFREQFSLDFERLRLLAERTGGTVTASSLRTLAGVQVLSSVTIGPLLNSLLAMGEEIGWRGFLYANLRSRFSTLQTHIMVALIWSLWHLPLNLQGYNFGLNYWGAPWLGMLAMFVFCFSLQLCLSLVMEKTNSLWAPALLHGAVNACAGLGLLFQTPSSRAELLRILGPTPVGLLSGVPLLLLAFYILYKERTKENELC